LKLPKNLIFFINLIINYGQKNIIKSNIKWNQYINS